MNPKMLTMETTRYYDQNADSFWEGTKDHDVTQNYTALLSSITVKAPFKILDFGCGPGRDLIYFSKLGHEAVGLDGCLEFCRAAEQRSKCKVWHQDFIDLKLPSETFDGIFANASLFHVPRSKLQDVLSAISKSLKVEGILFSSNPRGKGENFEGGRYGNFMELSDYAPLLTSAGFEMLSHYYRPTGKPLNQQPWLAVVSRRIE